MKKFTKEKTGESLLLPLEFVDEEGTQIAATMFGSGIEKYQSILEPMKCYLVSNGNVKLANKKYTSIKTDYSLSLDAMCKITEILDDPQLPKAGFSFTPIAKIADVPNFTVIDIIGIVKTVNEATPFPRKDGTQTVKRSIVLCDDTDRSIEVALWGAFAENEFREQEIIAFRGLRVSEYNSGRQLGTINDTSIVRDPVAPRVDQLQEWMQKFMAVNEIVPLASKLSPASNLVLIAEMIKAGENIPNDPNYKGMYCLVSGTIITIQHEKGFSYNGCKKCKKKVGEDGCSACKEARTVPFYNFNMKISDGSESIWIHIFGEQGDQIIGKPAVELVQIQAHDSETFKKVMDKPKGNVNCFIIIAIDEHNADKSEEGDVRRERSDAI